MQYLMYSCNMSCLYITATVRRITLKLSACLHDDAETWVYWNLLNLLQDPSMVGNKIHQRKLLFCLVDKVMIMTVSDH